MKVSLGVMVAVLVSGWGFQANAYIPKARQILGRTAKAQGKSPLFIQTEVNLQTATGTPILIRESWWTDGGNRIRLKAEGISPEKFELHILYRDGKRYAIDSERGVRSLPESKETLPTLMYTSSESGLMSDLIERGLVPAESLRRGKAPASLVQVDNSGDSFVQLSRASGAPAYYLGGDTAETTGVWIDLNTFHVRKVKFATGAVAEVETIAPYKDDFVYPKATSVQWNNQVANIKVNELLQLGPAAKKHDRFTVKDLEDTHKKLGAKTRIPGEMIAREFYSRFR